MEWLGQEHGTTQQQHSSHTQAAELPKQQQQQQQQQQGRTGQKARGGTQSTQAAAAAGGGSGSGRGRKKQAAVKTPAKAGPLDRFLRPAAAVAATAAVGSTQPVQQEQELLRQSGDGEQLKGAPSCSDAEDCGSPEVPSLADRLAARATAAGAAAGSRAGLEADHRASPRSRQRSASPQHAGAAAVTGAAWQVPPAKKASTDLAKVLLNSPVSRGLPAAAGASPGEEHDAADVGGRPGPSSAVYYSQYQTLLEQMGVASPDQQQHPQQRARQGGKAVKGLFTSQQQRSAADSQLARPAQLQMQQQPECIELLDSPMPMAPITGAGVKKKTAGIEVVDLT